MSGKMYLRGSFNNWQPVEMTFKGNDKWEATMEVPLGDFEFKFTDSMNWSGTDWGGSTETTNKLTERGGNIFLHFTRAKYKFVFDKKTMNYTALKTMSDSNYCQNCNEKTYLFFCPECGTVLEYPPYIAGDESRESHFRGKIDAVVKKYKKAKSDVDKTTNNLILTETVKKYFNKIALLQKQCNDNTVYKLYKDTENFPFDKMQELGENCKENECRIVLVGAMKAGKSCLINALLGRELASISIVPETATLTKFRYTKQDTINATFYNQTEWDELWESVNKSKKAENFIKQYEKLNAKSFEKNWIGRNPEKSIATSDKELKEKIKMYSSAGEPTHFFVKELEIGLKDFDIPANVVFVDTPGLNDPVAYRSEVTRKYLKKANVVLLLMKAEPLDEDELQFIVDLFDRMDYSKERVYILGTQYDAKSDALNYWKNIKSNWLESLSCKYCYGSEKIAEERLIPVAPYFYTLLKKYAENKSFNNTFSEKDINDLTNGVNNILGYKKSVDIDPDIFKELVEKYDYAEAMCIYERMRDPFEFRMNNNFNELIDFSNVNFFRQLLIDVPVKNADNIIIDDIRKKYVKLKEKLIDSSSKICENQEDAVLISTSDDIREQINELSEQISKTKKTAERLDMLAKKMTNQAQKMSNKMCNYLLNNI